MAGHALIERAIEGRSGIARLAVSLDRPVVGLGASAALHYANLPKLLGAQCVTPADADVANALGAVVGHVRVTVAARVSQPVEGLFRLNSDEGIRDFPNEEEALRAADTLVRGLVVARALSAGANDPEITVKQDIRVSTIEDRRMFIEADVLGIASGRPAIVN
jgi:N-methylhydantoinase A/oxoprolinase/acetone carboxylase beta subunit